VWVLTHACPACMRAFVCILLCMISVTTGLVLTGLGLIIQRVWGLVGLAFYLRAGRPDKGALSSSRSICPGCCVSA
jgi:hypothetical protein